MLNHFVRLYKKDVVVNPDNFGRKAWGTRDCAPSSSSICVFFSKMSFIMGACSLFIFE